MERTFGKYIVTKEGDEVTIKFTKAADRIKLLFIALNVLFVAILLGYTASAMQDKFLIALLFIPLSVISVISVQRTRITTLRIHNDMLEAHAFLKKPKKIDVKFFFFTDDFFEQLRTGKTKNKGPIALVVANRAKLINLNVMLKNKEEVKEMAAFLNEQFAPYTYTVEEQKQIFREKMGGGQE